jgi:U3 small nucleolar RNA-associated protein 11
VLTILDEFHFAMMSSKTKDGIRLGDRGNKALSHDVVLLLKTQDAGYLRTMLQQTRLERRKLEKAVTLTAGLHGSSVEDARKVFVDSAEELAYATDVEDSGGGSEEGPALSAAEPEKRLKALITREKELMLAEQELERQRGKMSNSIGGVNKNGVKFKVRERKR